MEKILRDKNSIKSILEQYGSPLFLYSEMELEEQLNHLKNIRSKKVEVFYSMKANPNPFICNYFSNKGLGIEVASGNELTIALKSGFEPQKIFFTAPCKTTEELELAISHNVLAINIDNTTELNIISELAEKYNKEVSITFRVYQNLINNSNIGTNMTSKSAQFGLTEEEIKDIIQKGLKPGLKLLGLHTFQGSQIYNINVYGESWERLIYLAKDIEKHGYNVSFLGIGGGFGYDIYQNKHFDITAFEMYLDKLFEKEKYFLADKQLMIEMGNFLVSKSGFYICQVQYVKQREDLRIAIVDGGTHHIEGESRVSKKFHGNRPFYKLGKKSNEQKVTIVGKLLSPNDIIAFEVEHTSVESGDILIFQNSGAYALTSSRLQFLSHDEPVELALSKNNNLNLIRKKKKPIDNYDFSFLKYENQGD